jgi:hypothetical protein
MKNITLAVEEGVLREVRRYAAERNTSVNGLVREFLQSIADREARAERARERIARLSEASRARIGSKSWRREDLHER